MGLPAAAFGDDFALGFDALEVFAEEFLHRAIEIEAVLLVVEAMSLVVLDHVVDMHAAFAQGVDHLVALVDVHTGVVGALYHQQRGFDPFGVECRGVFAQHLGVLFGIADHLVHHVEHRFPVGRDGLQEREEVRYAHVVHGAGIEVGILDDTLQRGVTAVTAAVDGDLRRIGDALFDQPVHAVRNVVLHGLAPFAVGDFGEFAPEAGRTAEVHLQYGVAAVGQELHLGVESPRVAGPRAAVGDRSFFPDLGNWGQVRKLKLYLILITRNKLEPIDLPVIAETKAKHIKTNNNNKLVLPKKQK